jgi:hypothetical protein
MTVFESVTPKQWVICPEKNTQSGNYDWRYLESQLPETNGSENHKASYAQFPRYKHMGGETYVGPQFRTVLWSSTTSVLLLPPLAGKVD